jgi:hypothetical protein
MVAIIHTATSVAHVLRYNEWKVAQGTACCIGAENYLSDPASLSWSMKLRRLTDLAILNGKVLRNAVHISVNFRPGERVTTHLLQRVARSYMACIGYGRQPYLVYQHLDAGHPHIHVVSISVNEGGRRLSIRPGQLKEAKEKVEREFGLVPRLSARPDSPAIPIQRLHYGAAPMTTAVARITDLIFGRYLFGSFEEMNALMREYGITARRCRGKHTADDYVVFQAVDERGKHRGVPLKASLLPSKPTLAWLEMKYRVNRINRRGCVRPVKNAILRAFHMQRPETFEEMTRILAQQSIQILAPDDSLRTGRLYVDHRTGGVFTEHLLGNLPAPEHLVPHPVRQHPSFHESWFMRPGHQPDAVDPD